MKRYTRASARILWLAAGAGTGVMLALIGILSRMESDPEPAGRDARTDSSASVVPAPPRSDGGNPGATADPEPLALPPPAPEIDPFCDDGPSSAGGHRRPPIPGTERAYYEDFRALAQNDPVRFVRTAESVALGDGPLPERVAALRAASERLEWPTLGPWFRTLLMRGADPNPASEQVVFRTYVFRLLIRRASPVAPGRAVLEEMLQERGVFNPEERVTVVRNLLDGRDPEAPGRLFGYFVWEDDSRVLAAAGGALRAMGREDQLIPAMESALAVTAMDGGEEVEPTPEQ